MHPNPVDIRAELFALIEASWMSQALCVAAELRLADILEQGPKSAESLAAETGCPVSPLKRLMRALTTLCVFAETGDDLYALTPLGQPLCSGGEQSLRAWALWWGNSQWPTWGALLHSIRTGESARKLITGHDGYDVFERDPAVGAVFDQAMADLTRFAAAALLRLYDFAGVRQVVDVGGGNGVLLLAILARHHGIRGILYERARVLPDAAQQVGAAGLTDRCELAAGDFFASVPSGGDLYLMKSVLHSFDDDRCVTILENIRRAMAGGARLLLLERVLPARMTGSLADRSVARADLHMLVAGIGSKERRLAEFDTLLSAAGMRIVRHLPTGTAYHLIEASAVG